MIRNLPALLLAASAFALAFAPTARADEARSLDVNGVQRTYLLHLPPTDSREPHPLLLVFHGGGGQGKGMVKLTRIEAAADRSGFIVAFPDGIDRHWNDGRATIKNKVDDIGFTKALLDTLEHEYPIDATRVAVAGISNGAIFAERVACDLGDRVGTIAAIAGTLASDYAPQCHPARPVSVLQFDGTSDPIMPFDGGHVKDFGGKGEGGNVLSVAATAAFWSRVDACRADSSPQPLPTLHRFDPTRVTLAESTGCRDGRTVHVFAIDGGGHTWPGGEQYLPMIFIGRTTRQIDASDIIVRYVAAHPRH